MQTRYWKYLFSFLILIFSGVVIAIFQIPDSYLHVVACNVGQGDAILVTYKNIQILTDGGPDKSVLTCLGKYMPFWDREIELVISTHPDADHATGLIDVFKNYKVDKILINPIDPGTETYRVLKNAVQNGGSNVINPARGLKLRVGLIYLDILMPPAQLSFTNYQFSDGTKAPITQTNKYSIVSLLSFGKFKALLPGDIPPEISDDLANNFDLRGVEYIKIPHHGSNNGITENLISAVKPKIAVISVGKNMWGFPKEEVLNLLKKYGVKVLRTDKMGDVKVVTDGRNTWEED